MPTELKVQIVIENVTAKDYHRVVYSDDQCIRRFHGEVNADPKATATPWEAGRRSVTFHMALNVPGMVKKLIGSDCIRVTEVCTLTWKGSSFELVSAPVLDFPGANKFTTSGVTTVCDVAGGCQVDCVMKCSAALPWPMQGSVEGVMAQEGKATITKYLEFTRQACEEDRNNRAPAGPSLGAGIPAAARATATEEDEEDDAFYDASEDQSGSGGGGGGSRQQAGPLAAYEPMSRDEAALQCLLKIHASCFETATLMKQMQQSLQRMDENIATIRAAVVQARPAQQAPRSSVTWTYVLCLSLAGASVASMAYLRARHTLGASKGA